MALRQLAPLALQQLPRQLTVQANVANRSLKTSSAPQLFKYHYVSACELLARPLGSILAREDICSAGL